MRDAQPTTIYLKDYKAPAYLIDKTDLRFELGEDVTQVHSKLTMRKNPERKGEGNHALVLDGIELKLVELAIDGEALSAMEYFTDTESLTINKDLPDQFVFECTTEIKPQENTSLEGLYKSSGMYCTQCEAEGFRKITYYLDRPDVMSVFSTQVIADKANYPMLLSNGNPAAEGELDDGRHWVTWEDPFKKPAYLFALVAGDLVCIKDTFTTCSGREIDLRIFVEERNSDKCDHALYSLKNSMKWDEEVYGREYDLDIFMIVAVDAFNMGAMENKGLNIFNSSCVLAKPDTATDATYQRIEAIVAHEYFHNWSGNRVTCRDWFQLSLKEGFTVFRDACFSADMHSETVKRVEDVNFLRTVQFSEDAGPLSHPIRPDSFMEISNFYTVTIYEKGAEVVGMIHTLLGPDLFRKGSDLYFDRHDGQAVTTEDFVKAMEDASGKDLAQFRYWYSQSGTPEISVSGEFNAAANTYTLKVKQASSVTAATIITGQTQQLPFHIPVKVGLLAADGKELSLKLVGDSDATVNENLKSLVLDVTEAEQNFEFTDITEAPVPSLLRGFSAPVKLSFNYSRDDLVFLLKNDSDGFCRWDAGQQLAIDILLELVQKLAEGDELSLDARLVDAFASLLAQSITDDQMDKAMVAHMLQLPSEKYLIELIPNADVDAIHQAREFVRKTLADKLSSEWLHCYHAHKVAGEYQPQSSHMADRALKNRCLGYIVETGTDETLQLCLDQYHQANNMTDAHAAMSALVNSTFESERNAVLADFYSRWQHDVQMVDQWFSLQAGNDQPEALARIKHLMEHEKFDIKNPNKVRSVVGVFANQNLVNFHHKSGSGYQFLADQVLVLDKLNPQIASRLLTPLTGWRNFDAQRQKLMKAQLERVLKGQLSKDVYEIASKGLKD